MKAQFEIVVGGQKLSLRSDLPEATLREIGRRVDERLVEIQKAGVTSGQRAALLAALSLCEDLVRVEANLAAIKAAVKDRGSRVREAVTAFKARRRKSTDDADAGTAENNQDSSAAVTVVGQKAHGPRQGPREVEPWA